MSDPAAASQPWYLSLNRNQWNILLAANLGWLPRDVDQRYFAGRPDELQPGSRRKEGRRSFTILLNGPLTRTLRRSI